MKNIAIELSKSTISIGLVIMAYTSRNDSTTSILYGVVAVAALLVERSFSLVSSIVNKS